MNLRLHEFVAAVKEAESSGTHKCPPTFVECSVGAERPWVWTFSDVTVDPNVRQWLSESVCVALIHTDGSAQLLSRDEDECRLFATLWELER